MPKGRILTFLVLAITSFACSAAEDALTRGEALAAAAETRVRGYGDSQATLEMELANAAGETARRTLRVSSRDAGDTGDQVLMVFESPRDLAGTALLSWNHPVGDDEQWLFLPAVQRVKQIGSRNKSGPFMASEFAYEDIVTPFRQKYSHRWLRDETLDGLPCSVVERTPKDPQSGYARQLLWIDVKDSLVRRIDFYDRRNTLLKTWTARGYTLHADRHWRPAEVQMSNVQTRKRTTLRWRDYRFGTGLTAADFTQNALTRVK